MTARNVAIQKDSQRKLLRVACAGFWTLDDVRDYEREQRLAAAEMAQQGCKTSDLLLLIDCSALQVQSQDVILELDRILSAGSFQPKRAAVVVSSALVARQSARSGPAHGVFYNLLEAERWLLADQ